MGFRDELQSLGEFRVFIGSNYIPGGLQHKTCQGFCVVAVVAECLYNIGDAIEISSAIPYAA